MGDTAAAHARFEEAKEISSGFNEGRPQVLKAFACGLTGDYPEVRRVCLETIASQRAQGTVSSFGGALPLQAIAELYEGRLAAVLASIDEGKEIAERFGWENDVIGSTALQAHVAAQQGREEDCRRLAEEAMQRSLAKGLGWATMHARLALAELELGVGNLREALAHYDHLDADDLIPALPVSTPEIIDAALRLDEPERARSALDHFERWAPVSDAPLMKGLLARCRAVLADEAGAAERLYEEAIEHHAGAEWPLYQEARTELAYGEFLRRAAAQEPRRESSCEPPTKASSGSVLGRRVGGAGERLSCEATGESARRRDVSTMDGLTPQELQIARLVAERRVATARSPASCS